MQLADAATVWDGHYDSSAGYRYWPSEDLVRAVAGWPFMGRVLEVGCGNGANLWFLDEHAQEVVGMDVSDVALRAAERYMRRRLGLDEVEPLVDITLIRGDVTDRLPFPDESCDGVVDCLTSQHLPFANHRRVYREYWRVLRPGGRFFLKHLDQRTHSPRCVSSGQDYDYTSIGLFPQAGFTCLPPRARLRDACVDAGFLLQSVHGVTVGYDERDDRQASYTVVDAVKER